MASEDTPLLKTVRTTCTEYWNDSCDVDDLNYAIKNGATGATSNPQIVLNVMKKDLPRCKARAIELLKENPKWTEIELAWQLIKELSIRGAGILQPIFGSSVYQKGKLSLQTNPQLYRDADAMLEQAMEFNKLAPNIMVKLPATQAGILAMEEATARGVSINATVSFTVAQTMAVAKAVERGLDRYEKQHGPGSAEKITPVCTLMVGRLDDWLRVLEKRDGIIVAPGTCDWAGIAAFKKAHELYKKHGYRTKLLAAAFRHHLHWSELIGGDVILTITCEWARLFNGSDVEVKERFNNPVPESVMQTLLSHFPDFRRAYDEDGLSVAEFDTFGPAVRTLRTFISAYHDLLGVVRDMMLPDPDIK